MFSNAYVQGTGVHVFSGLVQSGATRSLHCLGIRERESETTVGGPRKHHNVLCSTKNATLSLDYRSEVVQVVRLPSDNPETRFRMHLVSHQIRVTTSRHCSHKVSEMSRNCLSTSVDNPTDIPAVSPECVLCRRSMLVREVI